MFPSDIEEVCPAAPQPFCLNNKSVGRLQNCGYSRAPVPYPIILIYMAGNEVILYNNIHDRAFMDRTHS